MSVLLAIIVIVIAIAICIRLYEKSTNAMCRSTKSLEGRTTIVTGGTAGMGLEIATDFARRGAKVIIACPFQEEGAAAREKITESTGNKKVIFKLMNLASLNSVREFAADILNEEDRLDILINNAGVGIPNNFLTADGMRFIMQVNYFGHFLLTLLLLPLLKKTGKSKEPSRIVNTSSVLHYIGIIDFENFNRSYKWMEALSYGKSKLCFILFSRELNRKLAGSNVVINTVDPGAVGTRIVDSTGKYFGMIIRFVFNTLYKVPWEGAQTALHVALDDKAGEVSGEFFKNCKQTRAIRWAYSNKLAKRLWEESVILVKLEYNEVDKCFESL